MGIEELLQEQWLNAVFKNWGVKYESYRFGESI